MTCHVALIVTVAGLFISLGVGAYVQHRLFKNMASEMGENKQ